MKTSNQIRQDFFEFFRQKEHAITPSAPVVPKEDPTLLFTNAGMNQFKSIFLGDEPGYKQDGKQWQRAANTQRCIRVSGKHNDLEEVGHDTYHHTLFEMLGNWSFGDYFKKEAIEWAWELLVDKWGLEPDRLYATVFAGDEEDGLPVDEESIELWKSVTSINPNHILKFDKKDNFWEMGDTGPCGPCSEVHVDLRTDEERKKVDGATLVNADDPRVMEIWNLVFIQFNRSSDGSLSLLPDKHVDTGMGFERICAVIQGKSSNYDSDVFTPLLKHISKLSKEEYGKNLEKDIAMRVIADHIRAVSFGIADGASPSNDGRGYVIRRILRRAIRYGWDKLNLRKPFMFELVETLSKQFDNVFPELRAQLQYVQNVVKSEEESFIRTLGQGIELFNDMAKGKSEISGDDAFKLHDTYGFPIDLTNLMARERGLKVDEAGFQERMQEQKERARKAGKFAVDHSDKDEWVFVHGKDESDLFNTEFLGYDEIESESKIIAYRKAKESYHIILDKTPFYAESGGQVADTGSIIQNDEKIAIANVQKIDGKHVHFTESVFEHVEAPVLAHVDSETRKLTEKHHSATHLLHAALREVLGNHVAQKGSLVNDEKLRFDFSHFKAVSSDELSQIEAIVNQKIQEDIHLDEKRDVPFDEAKQSGATMLFGEKYGDTVRIITFDKEFSSELCGGTHVNSTGKLGYFRIVSESSVAAGIRRIEAVTGEAALAVVNEERTILEKVKELAGSKVNPAEFIEGLLQQKKNLEKELATIKEQQSAQALDTLISNAKVLDSGIKLIAGEVSGANMNTLKQLGYDSLNRVAENAITILGSSDSEAGKVYLVATVTEDLLKSTSLKAGSIVGKLAKLVGGGGGGQPNLATAGGRFPEKLPEVFSEIETILKSEM